MNMNFAKLPLTLATAKKLGIDEKTLMLWLSVCDVDLPDKDYAIFIYQCVRTGLDPVVRQIYMVRRVDQRRGGVRGTVQTSIDGYRLIADRTGKYAGSDDPVFDEGLTQFEFLKTGREHPSTASISVYKLLDNGHIARFSATAAWEAYYPGDEKGKMWKKMPMLMLGKCAEALALRKAFPSQLSGLYITEEMMQASEADETNEVLANLLNMRNEKAVEVLNKMSKLGIKPDDPIVLQVLGTSIENVEDTEEGTGKLRKLWTLLRQHEKGAPWGPEILTTKA
jgi:phage recombination protein Bet